VPTLEDLQTYLDSINAEREVLGVKAVEVADLIRAEKIVRDQAAKEAAEAAVRAVAEAPVDVPAEMVADMEVVAAERGAK